MQAMQAVRRHPIRALGAALLLVLSVLLGALLHGAAPQVQTTTTNDAQAGVSIQQDDGRAAGTIYLVHTSYSVVYANLHDLAAASPLVVLGTVQDFQRYLNAVPTARPARRSGTCRCSR
jgi:hypothetical protein